MKRFGFVGVLVAGMIALAGQAAADGDASIGEKLFKGFLDCSSCHSLEAGETKVGPTLAGLFGRKAGSVEGYKSYSKAMVNSEVVWDEESLNEFLKNPMKFIPENKMEFTLGGVVPRVSSDQHRGDLIAYLKEATAQ
ncbi:MAG: c-type cytochrome [Paracoccaceae bacterium]